MSELISNPLSKTCICKMREMRCPFCTSMFKTRMRDISCSIHGSLDMMTEVRCTFCNR